MRLLKTAFHPDVSPEDVSAGSTLTLAVRVAARAIVVRGDDILLLFTQRYHDYSLPGGGVDEGEDKVAGLVRELNEETGAHGVHNIREFGRYDEYRPWYKSDADFIHMISYCYVCDINEDLGATQYESYEVANGMKPMWKNVHEAIEHNEKVIAQSEKKGVSIERETYLLKLIAQELLVS